MKGLSLFWGLALSLGFLPLLSRAYPAAALLQEEDDDADSDEDELKQLQTVLANRLGQNLTDEELVHKATTFLAQYFGGTEAPSSDGDSTRKANRTIILTIVHSKNETGNSLNHGQIEARFPTESPIPVKIASDNNGGIQVFESIVSTPTSTVPPPTVAPSPQPEIIINAKVAEESSGVGNIEDAIREAISVASGSQIAPSNQVNGQQQQQQQQQQQFISISNDTTTGVHNNAAQLPILWIHPYVTIPPPTTTERRAPTALGTFSKILGSIAEGNLGAAIQNSAKLGHVPELQDTARLAVGGILHTLASGITSGISSGFASGITSGVSSGLSSALSNGDITSAFLSGVSGGIATGAVNGANCQVLGNCPTLSPTIFRNVPETYRYKKKKD